MTDYSQEKKQERTQVPETNTIIVTLRIPESLHRSAKMKLADKGGSFQSVLSGLLAQWVEGESQAVAPSGQQETRYPREKQIIEQALDLYPEYASSQIKTIEHLLKPVLKVKVPNVKDKAKSTQNHAKTGTA
jgi:hypothetical protein